MKEDFDFLFNEHQGVGSFDSSYKNGAHWGFGAGQQSKQAEVDELRFQRDVLSDKVDELQKRIDELEGKNKILGMRLDVIQGVMQKEIDLIVQLKGDQS